AAAGTVPDEEPIADGMARVPEALDDVVPSTGPEPGESGDTPDRRVADSDRREQPRTEQDRRGKEASPKPVAPAEDAPPPGPKKDKILASPAVRQRARDLGIDLSQVRYSGDRIRHSDLDAFLLYSGAA